MAKGNSPSDWGLTIRFGARVDLIDTGSGHVLFDFQIDQRRAEMLVAHQAMDGEVPIRSEALEALLEQVRALGRWQGNSLQPPASSTSPSPSSDRTGRRLRCSPARSFAASIVMSALTLRPLAPCCRGRREALDRSIAPCGSTKSWRTGKHAGRSG